MDGIKNNDEINDSIAKFNSQSRSSCDLRKYGSLSHNYKINISCIFLHPYELDEYIISRPNLKCKLHIENRKPGKRLSKRKKTSGQHTQGNSFLR